MRVAERVAGDAVEVAVEDARVAGAAEENEGVGKRFEPEGEGGGEGLRGLRIVVPGEVSCCGGSERGGHGVANITRV